MATRLDAPGVRPPVPVDNRLPAAPVGDARQQAFQRSLQTLVGQTVNAQVLSKFNDGSYLVRVADTNARLLLPAGTQVGSELPLTVLQSDPRPSFQLGSGQGGGAAVLYTEGQPLPESELPSQAQQPGGRPGTGQAPPSGLPTGNVAGQGTPGASAQPGQAGAAAGQPPPTTTGTPPPPASTAGQAAGQAANAQASSNAAAQAAANNAANNAANSATLAAAASRAAAAARAGGGLADARAASGTDGAAAARPQSAAATLLSRAPLVPADQLPTLGQNTPQATLSPAARAIASALTAAYTTPGVPVTINGKIPLSAGGPPDAGELSQNLQRALSDSGLFYESHVAEWAEGKRPLQDLQREPQMQRMAQQAAQSAGEAAARALNGPDLSAAQMINQQLHTHEQGKLQWQGEAWPGQPMHWLVEREQHDSEGGGKQQRGRGEPEAAPVWRSGVRFRFPMLGKVGANVTLVGDQVHIQVQSGSEETAGTLRAWASALQTAMEAAGAPLASLTIAAGDGDGA